MGQINCIKVKATTNGTRHHIKNSFFDLSSKKNNPKKILINKCIKKNFGRDNKGRKRFFRCSGNHKKKYRMINFRRDTYDISGEVMSIEYDPNRSANIALIKYNNKYEYILAVKDLKVGDKIMSFDKVTTSIQNGNSLKLKDIPIGINICNVQVSPNSFHTIARSAGNTMRILLKDIKDKYVKVTMPSKEIRLLHKNCRATIGRIGNLQHNLIKLGKASKSFFKGRKPKSRGLAMNACDHKHGGGKNSSSIGLPGPTSATGLKTLGFLTRRNKRTSKFILVSRRKKNRR